MVFFPNLVADEAKTSSLSGGCDLSNSLLPPSDEYWFGTDQQGCDVYSLSVYGARPSVAVGVIAAVGTTLIGALVGLVAGFYGGKTDSVLSRIFDIFFGVPYIVGAHRRCCPRSTCRASGASRSALTLLSWPVAARMVRGKTIEAKGQDYTLAARALGASNGRIMLRHILPNAIGPSIVVAVISLGAVHRRGGHVVLPGPGHPAAGVLLGHDDRRRPEHVLPGTVDPVVPAGIPEPHRAGLHPARATRSARPSTRSCGGDAWPRCCSRSRT